MTKYTIRLNDSKEKEPYGDFRSVKGAEKALTDRGWVKSHPPDGYEFLLQRAGRKTLSAQVVWAPKPHNIEDLPSKSDS